MVVNIQCGLGNQLFEYAFAKALQVRFNKDVQLFVPGYENMIKSDTRRLELQSLNTTLEFLNEKQMQEFFKQHDFGYYFVESNRDSKIFKILMSLIPRKIRKQGYKYLIEDSHNLLQSINSINNGGGG